MSARVPVKSIIKQQAPLPPNISDEHKAKAERDRKNLKIALRHAYLIQYRKEIESRILNSITTLLDYPDHLPLSADESQAVAELLRDFQPSDLDALVEERRIDGKCGYVLCANAPRSATMGRSASWKVKEGGQDFCSSKCVRQTLSIKAQLCEIPAWERTPQQHVSIVLPEDGGPAPVDAHLRHQVANDVELAMERGEKTASMRPNQVVSDRVVERPQVPFKPLSSINQSYVSSTAIEGYEPHRANRDRKPEFLDESDDTAHDVES
ncbi:MAG: hypothetical protein FE78DRAFT_136598 [Acidomyces sp. 'richmondensis']|nr:MAG: hypothetical protein FE78DRAFT_136598 [Acidomyces sp. 'richmondensis']